MLNMRIQHAHKNMTATAAAEINLSFLISRAASNRHQIKLNRTNPNNFCFFSQSGPSIKNMPPKKAASGVAAKKKAPKNGYQMPEPLAAGSSITDMTKQLWKIGPSIGCGGFGEIYSAYKVGAAAVPKHTDDYPFVVKIVSTRALFF